MKSLARVQLLVKWRFKRDEMWHVSKAIQIKTHEMLPNTELLVELAIRNYQMSDNLITAFKDSKLYRLVLNSICWARLYKRNGA